MHTVRRLYMKSPFVCVTIVDDIKESGSIPGLVCSKCIRLLQKTQNTLWVNRLKKKIKTKVILTGIENSLLRCFTTNMWHLTSNTDIHFCLLDGPVLSPVNLEKLHSNSYQISEWCSPHLPLLHRQCFVSK